MQFDQVALGLWAVNVFWVLGQIWFVQIVVYPLFARVGEREYVDYHCFYTRKIPFVIIVPGFLSFLVPIPLALFGPDVPMWMSVANIATGIIGLLITVFLQIPRHGRLEKARDERTIAELITFNWPRTMSITMQAVVTFLMVMHASST
jgi:hypothetical protein